MSKDSSVGIVYKYRVAKVEIDLALESHVLRTRQHAVHNFGYGDFYLSSRESRRMAAMDIVECRERQCVDAGAASRARLDAMSFFTAQPKCTIELVYADTHEIVQRGVESALLDTHRAHRRPGRLSMYTSNDGVPYPAWTHVHLNVLSSEKGHRAFKLKATSKSEVDCRVPDYVQTLVAYSRPFIVVGYARCTPTQKI